MVQPFFGVFNEFLLPNIPDGETSWFDNAAASVDGPGETTAADPTDNDEFSDYDHIVEFEDANYGVEPMWDVSPFGSCSVNYSTMTRNFWAAFADATFHDSYAGGHSDTFLDECQMAYMSIIPGPDRAALGRTTGTGPDDLPPVGGPQNTVPGWENGKYARPRNALMQGQGVVNGVQGTSDGSFGMMCVSFISDLPYWDISTAPAFFNSLHTIGYKFGGYPYVDDVYEVVESQYNKNENSNNRRKLFNTPNISYSESAVEEDEDPHRLPGK